MKPTCPKCGSVNVRTVKRGVCLEPDCKHEGSRDSFRQQAGYCPSANTKWRDPIAMLPGGYDENA